MLNKDFLSEILLSNVSTKFGDTKNLFKAGAFCEALNYFKTLPSSANPSGEVESVMKAMSTLYEVYLEIKTLPQLGWEHYNRNLFGKADINETVEAVCVFMQTVLENFEKNPDVISCMTQYQIVLPRIQGDTAERSLPLSSSPVLFAVSPRSPDGLQSQVPTPIRFV